MFRCVYGGYGLLFLWFVVGPYCCLLVGVLMFIVCCFDVVVWIGWLVCFIEVLVWIDLGDVRVADWVVCCLAVTCCFRVHVVYYLVMLI